jgi:hypothetical protein
MSKTTQENKAKKAKEQIKVEVSIEKSEQKAVNEENETTKEVVETSETPQEEVSTTKKSLKSDLKNI